MFHAEKILFGFLGFFYIYLAMCLLVCDQENGSQTRLAIDELQNLCSGVWEKLQ